MHNKLLSAVSAAALALAVSATVPVSAQAQQLQDSVASGLAAIGYDTSGVGTITSDQAAQIENVLNSTDADEQKVARVDAILGQPGDAGVPASLGVAQLEDSVKAAMVGLNVDTAGVETLSLTELAQIENVVNSSDEETEKRARIEEIMGRSEGSVDSAWGVQQLQSSVAADMVQLGFDTESIDALSLGELAQIENVVSSSEAEDVKRQRIEQILAQ